MQPKLVLIVGLPGAGKSTLACQLETSIPAVRLAEDEWLLDLGIDLHDEAARTRMEALFWQLSQRLLSLGQSVILESGFWLRSERDAKRLVARSLGAGVELRYQEVSFEERWRRISIRNREPRWSGSPISRDELARWDQFFEAPDSSERLLFDAV